MCLVQSIVHLFQSVGFITDLSGILQLATRITVGQFNFAYGGGDLT